MMELQEIDDYSSDNPAFVEGTDNTDQDTTNSLQHQTDSSEKSKLRVDIAKDDGTKSSANPTTAKDTSKTVGTSNTDDTDKKVSPSCKTTLISNDKCQDAYNLLTTSFDKLCHVGNEQKTRIQDNNEGGVTLATLTRHYKITQITIVVEELISIISQLGNYDDEQLFKNPILDRIVQESRRAHDEIEHLYLCDLMTEKVKLETLIGKMATALSDLSDSIASWCSGNDSSSEQPQELLKFNEQIANVRKKLPSSYQRIY